MRWQPCFATIVMRPVCMLASHAAFRNEDDPMPTPGPPLIAPGAYHAYLVRLWQDHPSSPWRASAQSVQSGEVVRFATLEALWQFLERATGPSPPDDETCEPVRPDFSRCEAVPHTHDRRSELHP
jgi:hypothetical protein